MRNNKSIRNIESIISFCPSENSGNRGIAVFKPKGDTIVVHDKSLKVF
jgi:hypothetical protein